MTRLMVNKSNWNKNTSTEQYLQTLKPYLGNIIDEEKIEVKENI